MGITLDDHLAENAPNEVGALLREIALAAAGLAERIAAHGVDGDLAAPAGVNVQGEAQKRLDVLANDTFIAAARRCSVAYALSEELEDIVVLGGGGALALALDPLDGSSNIAVNGAIGTLFSVFAADPAGAGPSFLRAGTDMLAAGYAVYGAQTAFGFTVGRGTHIFTLDRRSGAFVHSASPKIPEAAPDFAINASNYRRWPQGIRTYFDDCLRGEEGPRKRDFNMRWMGAAVGELHRILMGGGIYLYPADNRNPGRLRLIYEAMAIAFLAEQAGGAATDGHTRILDLLPSKPHQRTGLCFGAAAEVAQVARYLDGRTDDASPLFNRRGLLTAGA